VSIFSAWRGGLLHQWTEEINGVTTPVLRLGGKSNGTPTPLRRGPAGLYTLSYLHSGASRIWIVVPARQGRRLEQALAHYPARIFRADHAKAMRCCQWVNHLDIWLSPGTMRSWGLTPVCIQQNAGELLVLPPGVYSQAWDLGACLSEEACYADGASAARASEAEAYSESCVVRGPFQATLPTLDSGARVRAHQQSPGARASAEPRCARISRSQAALQC
jgi:hypothetical protein